MTIYVAICDDNVADRKHLERLLNREKDARLSNNNDVLYIDSYGSEEALMRTPIKYDIFFIDVTEAGANGMDVAKELRSKGVIAPIVLCSSSINYTSYVSAPKELIFLEKPLNPGQISHLIDVASDYTCKKVPLLEIRCKKETHFIKYTDFVKASSKGQFNTEIALSDGSYITMLDSIKALYKLCLPYGCFVFCGKDIINALHIKSYEQNGFHLSNNDFIKFGLTQKNDIIAALTKTISLLKSKD